MTSTREAWIGLALRHFVAIAAVVALGSYAWIYSRADADQPVHSDGYSYYVYVPSVAVYGDPTLEALARDWYGGEYPDFAGIKRWPSTGHFLNPHPIGTAVLMSPFIFAAHALTRWSNLPPDGFSLFYQHGAALAGLFYCLAGVAILRRTLARHFTPGVVLATLITIMWGTNLFHYGVFDGAFSHAFSFFLLCAFADLSERWWDAPHAGRTLALGAIAGLIVLARHTNAIFLLVLPLYGLTSTGQDDGASLAGGAGRGVPPTAGPSPVIASVGPRMGGAVRRQDPGREAWSALRHRTTALWQRRAALLLMAGVAAAVFAPQLGVYRYATGRWLASPYAALGVGFDFSSPHLLGVLIGTRKGLLFWSPALLLAIGGFFVVHPFARRFLAATLVAFALDTYLIASWWDWQFGGSYGHRAFVDGYGLLAIFVAACYSWAAARRRATLVVSAFAVVAVALSVAQMIQYWNHILPIADTTWDQYRGLFLRWP